MASGLYARWMYEWETRLTTRDTNRIVRPLEWGFEWLDGFAGADTEEKRGPGAEAPILAAVAVPRAEARCYSGSDAAAVAVVEQVDGETQVAGAKAPSSNGAVNAGTEVTAYPVREFVAGAATSAAEAALSHGVYGTGESVRSKTALKSADSAMGFGPVSAVGVEDRPLDDGTPFQAADVSPTDFARMVALNEAIVARSDEFYGYETPTDFRLERRHPQLFPTNVRPETLAQDAEMKRAAEEGELDEADFLRFTSPVRTPYPENDQVNARWYPAPAEKLEARRRAGQPLQAIVVMPQWNADAISHNALCSLFNRFGISALRLSKPYHDIRRPAELERSDYAVSSNVGRTISACRQAVVDIRSCMDWLETQGYTQFGVLGTSLGSCYAFIAAAHDPRLQVCAFNHASTWFGDVAWEGQSTRHVRAGFAQAGLTQDQVRQMFAGISPMSFMDRFAASPRRTLVVHATYDLTFPLHLSLDVLKNFRQRGMDFVSRVLPCGHYTTGETPYKYLDGWYLGSFVYDAFRRLREGS